MVASATAAAMRRLGAKVEVVNVEELAPGAAWSHRQANGEVRTIIDLVDGRSLDSDAIGAVLNRARYPPAPFFPRPRDRDYAVMETFALLLSWLQSLSALVVNRPSPRGLGGSERTLLEWLHLAVASGLTARRVRFTTDGRRFHVAGRRAHQPPFAHWGALGPPLDGAVPAGARPTLFAEEVGALERVTVIGERTFGARKQHAAALRRLAATAGCSLLEVELASSPTGSDPLFCGANPFPTQLNSAEIEALAAWLVEAHTRPRPK